RATRRRATNPATAPAALRFGDLVVDLGRQLVLLGGSPVHLTRTEYRLLEAMVTNPGKLLTHRWLLQRVWGPRYEVESNYLRVFVRQLRQKLGDDAASPTYIITEPAVGYRWMQEPHEPQEPTG